MSDTAPIQLVPAPSLIGMRLNGFVITAELSVGGMGVVYEARHALLGLRAAVKLIRPELCDRPDLSARFLREALALSAVKHRNVVEILDFGALGDGAQYILMEFLEGETLAQIIAREAPMKPQQALHICAEILAGLDAAHQVGVIHRDLKPANIVLTKQSSGELNVKVLDFGLARVLDSAQEAAGRASLRPRTPDRSSLLAGTPEYLSPEQAAGEQVGAQGDLYGLGVILFEMLAGKLPFTGVSSWELIEQHRYAIPPALRQLVPSVDPLLDMFVRRLLQKNPGDRPMGAKEAGEEVAFLLSSVIGQGAPARRWNRARLLLVGAGVSAAGLLAIGLTAPPAPRPPILLDELVVTAPVAAGAPPRRPPPPARIATAPRPRPAAPANTCEVTASWRRAIREQYEALEKLSLARVADEAPPAEVARIRQRARGLATLVNNARGDQCRQVEADLEAWRTALR